MKSKRIEPPVWAPGELGRIIADRQRLARRESEDFLRRQSEALLSRQSELWKPKYDSVQSFLRSVMPNRMRLKEALGIPAIEAVPDIEPHIEWHPFVDNDAMSARWLYVAVADGLYSRAIFAYPKNAEGRVPLVIAQHGIGSSPERVMGYEDATGAYHGYGRELVKAGYAVLAPQHITEIGPRSRLHRMCVMLGFTLWGLELYKLSKLLDVALTQPEIDPERVGMWGVSLGGAYTLFGLPIEERIKVGICTAWFNDRFRKMIIDDPRYSCFLSTTEEYVFLPNWLREFHDSSLISLVCPRPFQIQSGKGDNIAWWPFIVDEFKKALEPYSKLGKSEALQLDLREGGHETHVDSGLEFLRTWL